MSGSVICCIKTIRTIPKNVLHHIDVCTGLLHHFWVVGREWISASSTVYRRYINAALYIHGNMNIIPLCGNAKRLNQNEKCCNMIQMNVKLYRYPSWEYALISRAVSEHLLDFLETQEKSHEIFILFAGEKYFIDFIQRKISTSIRLYQNFIGFTENFRMYYSFSLPRIVTTLLQHFSSIASCFFHISLECSNLDCYTF